MDNKDKIKQKICTYHKDIIVNAKKKVSKLKRESYVSTVVQFDLPQSTSQIIKNQQQTIEKMLKHNKICSELVEKNSGIVIKEIGDAVLAIFPSITAACICAINVICNLKKFNRNIKTKVTVAYGSIVEVTTRKEPDIYGKAVNLCNRMGRWAEENTILLESNNVKELKRYLPKDDTIHISEPFCKDLKEFEKQYLCRITVN